MVCQFLNKNNVKVVFFAVMFSSKILIFLLF